MEDASGILASRLTRHNETKVKGCQRRCFDVCCVAQHAADTSTQSSQGTTTPAEEASAIANEPVVFVPGENCRNPLRETSARPTEGLLQSRW